jgi:hypothetical protein
MVDPSEVDGYNAFYSAARGKWLRHLVDIPADVAIKAFIASRELDTMVQIPPPEDPHRKAWKKGWAFAQKEYLEGSC